MRVPDATTTIDSWFSEEALLHTDAPDVTFWVHPDTIRLSPILLDLAQNFRYLVMPLR